MTTIEEFAAENDMQIHELRAFADDLLNAYPADADVIPADVEATLREALAESAPDVEA